MRRSSCLAAAIVGLLAVPVAAQTPPATPPSQRPKPATPIPAGPNAPYKPDFEIPTTDGSGAQKADQPAAGAETYVIGPQDSLSIIVADEAELTGKFRVDSDGTISMPYLGRVPLAGLSLADAQDKITALLKKDYLKNPQVRLEVDQFKARSVLVTGEVRTPGKVPLLGTTMSLLEALALAGSPTQNASAEVLVMHPPKAGQPAPQPIAVNRKDLELGKVGRDLVLQDGDIVNVPIAKRFFVSGFVKNPGSFVLEPGTTMGQAIVLAGGLTDRGSDRRLSVVRMTDGKSVEVPVRMEDPVLPNDEIKVKPRFF